MPGNLFTRIRLMQGVPFGGFYSLSGNILPYGLSEQPLEHFTLFEVQEKQDAEIAFPLTIQLNEDSAVAAFSGFYKKESWGRWTSSERASIMFSNALPKKFRLLLYAATLKPNVGVPLTLTVGPYSKQFVLTEKPQPISFDVLNVAPEHEIQISVPQLVSPHEVNGNSDWREMGIALWRLRLENSPKHK